MSKRTIAKFSRFVIFAPFAALLFSACTSSPSSSLRPRSDAPYLAAKPTGKLKSDDIVESSGVAASRCQPGVMWTHNDSGDDAFIFAINEAGDDLGTWKIPNAHNFDWEDIEAYKDSKGKCFVYVGDTGDNRERQADHAIYRVAEPDVSAGIPKSDRKNPNVTGNAEILQYTYPDFRQDAETLLVHPQTGDIYVITKRISGPAGVYQIKPVFDDGAIQRAEKIAEISVPAIPNGLLTGGDISPDGRRLVLCDYTAAYELSLPATSAGFADIWSQEPQVIDAGTRGTGEAICYSPDGNSLFTTSEGKHSTIMRIDRKR